MIKEMQKHYDQLYEDRVYTVDGKISSKDIIYNYINILEDIVSEYFTKDEILKLININMQKMEETKMVYFDNYAEIGEVEFVKDDEPNNKPIKTVVGDYIKNTVYVCPKCYAYVFDGHDTHCAKCQLKIDWSDVNE